jgi:hypothetical protein
MTVKLHEIRPIKIAHERFIESVEAVRVKLSNLSNTVIDTTATIAELTIAEGRLKDLERAVRESYHHG